MRRSTLPAAVLVSLTFFYPSRASAQDPGNPPPPVPVHAMPDLPPLPEPAETPLPSPAPNSPLPSTFPARDVQTIATVPPPDENSGFAVTPRSNEAPPGRPPAFRLLMPAARTEAEITRTVPAVQERPVEIPVVSTAPTPLLTVEKRGPASVMAGQPFVYEIVVHNAGTVTAQQVRVDDEFPASTRVLGAEPAATVAVQGGRLSWMVEGIPPGGERRFKVRVQPAGAGEWHGNATASVIISTSSSLRVQVTGPRTTALPTAPRMLPANLTVTQSGPENIALGQTAVFQIRITNNGAQPLKGLVLRDHVPAGLQHPAGPELEANLGTLEPGKTRSVTLTTRAVQPGRFTNDAVVITPDGQQAQAMAVIQVVGTGR